MEKICNYKNTEYSIEVKLNEKISITISTYKDKTIIHKYYKKYEIELSDIDKDSNDKKLEDYIILYENEFKKFIDNDTYYENLLKEIGFK